MTIAINQFVPAVHAEDAVGSTALVMDGFFRGLGFRSTIYALYRDAPLAERVGLFRKETVPVVDGDINILHFALPSPLTEFFRGCGGRRLLIYHNITPPAFFRGFQEDLVEFTALGLAEIASLADAAIKPIAYSDFSAGDLRGFGFENPVVLPFLMDWNRYRQRENPVLARIVDDGWRNLLFVGRLVPNKRQDDLIRLLATVRASGRQRTRLILVGKGREGEKFLYETHHLVRKLGDQPVLFAGRVNPAELVTYYRHADLFVSMSEHEGFGVPLVESMLFDLPVLAYAAAAIPDTLGDAGILLPDKNLEVAAAMVDRLLDDRELRTAVIARQRRRLLDFKPESALPRWESLIRGL